MTLTHKTFQIIYDETHGDWRLVVMRDADGALRGRATRTVNGHIVAKFGGSYPAGTGTTPEELRSMMRIWLEQKVAPDGPVAA
jgi:hypothetical protein